jgi:hypothetical protein
MCQAAFTLRCAWAWQLLKAKADSVHGVVAANAMLARDLREKETLVALLQARSMTSLNAAEPQSRGCTGTGLTPPTSAPGLGSPLPHCPRTGPHRLPHLRRGWAHPLPHLRRDWAHPLPHLRRDWAAQQSRGCATFADAPVPLG